MKHVGLNVAADPLMTFACMGAVGGFVVVVADDPGMHSSQNEQDTRNFAKFAKIPLLEPADSQEAKEYVRFALEISERFSTPVILRTCTRVSHSRSLVDTLDRTPPPPVGFVRDSSKFVAIPLWARKMRLRVEERTGKLNKLVEDSPLNRIERRGGDLGVITAGVCYQYVREVFPDASVLKLGVGWPLPDKMISDFARGVKKLLVVEELDPLIEEHIRALGIACEGRSVVPGIGELSPGRLENSRAALENETPENIVPVEESLDLPGRPPVLCPGCPHRGTYAALKKFDVVVMGDIGCYSLGTLPPLDKMESLLCMGAAIGMAHGMQKAGEPRKTVGILGDSTFFHSGITGLLNIAYNKGVSTIIVADNRITAMTGHQEHPGSGKTLMGETTIEASVEEFGRACGIKRTRTVNPYNTEEMVAALREETEADEPSLIVAKAPCPLHARKLIGPRMKIDVNACVACGACLKIGCPAIEGGEGKPAINPAMCWGCGLCAGICPKSAIVENTENGE
jgi:indolepyruvate ferredoxin oxidoreductase alpha subunit